MPSIKTAELSDERHREWTMLALVQPTLRREWQIRRADELVATLWLPVFRRGGRAELGGRRLALQASGLLRTGHVIRDEATNEQLARVLREGRRQVLELGNRTAEWKKLGRSSGYGFVGPD